MRHESSRAVRPRHAAVAAVTDGGRAKAGSGLPRGAGSADRESERIGVSALRCAASRLGWRCRVSGLPAVLVLFGLVFCVCLCSFSLCAVCQEVQLVPALFCLRHFLPSASKSYVILLGRLDKVRGSPIYWQKVKSASSKTKQEQAKPPGTQRTARSCTITHKTQARKEPALLAPRRGSASPSAKPRRQAA